MGTWAVDPHWSLLRKKNPHYTVPYPRGPIPEMQAKLKSYLVGGLWPASCLVYTAREIKESTEIEEKTFP